MAVNIHDGRSLCLCVVSGTFLDVKNTASLFNKLYGFIENWPDQRSHYGGEQIVHLYAFRIDDGQTSIYVTVFNLNILENPLRRLGSVVSVVHWIYICSRIVTPQQSQHPDMIKIVCRYETHTHIWSNLRIIFGISFWCKLQGEVNSLLLLCLLLCYSSYNTIHRTENVIVDCYTFVNGHDSGVTRYHLMMMSGGDGICFINYIPALSPHECHPGTYPWTTSSPPTLEYCHGCSSVLTQSQRIMQYSPSIQIKNDACYHQRSMRYSLIGISYGQLDMTTWAQYEGRLLNGAKRLMIWKTTVW